MVGGIKLKGFASSTPSSSTSSSRHPSSSKTPTTSRRPSSSTSKTPTTSRTPANSKASSSTAATDETHEDCRLPITPSSRQDLEPFLKKGGMLLHRWGTFRFYYEATITGVIEPKGSGPVKYNLFYKGWPKSQSQRLTAEEIFDSCRVWTEEEAKIAKEDVKNAQSGGNKSKKSRKFRSTGEPVIADSKEVSEIEPAQKDKKPARVQGVLDGMRSRTCFKLSNEECVFPPKITIEKILKKYADALKAGRKSPCPPHNANTVINLFIPAIEQECNFQLPLCLTSKELPEWFKLLNAKRASLDRPPVDMKDYRDTYGNMADDQTSKRIPLPEIMLPMLDSFDVIYLVRFIKTFNDRSNAAMDKRNLTYSATKKLYDPILNDILDFIDETVKIEMYDSE